MQKQIFLKALYETVVHSSLKKKTCLHFLGLFVYLNLWNWLQCKLREKWEKFVFKKINNKLCSNELWRFKSKNAILDLVQSVFTISKVSAYAHLEKRIYNSCNSILGSCLLKCSQTWISAHSVRFFSKISF